MLVAGGGGGESESICCTQRICKFLVSKSQCFRNKIVTLFESIHRFNYMYMYVLLLDQCCRSAKHVLYLGGAG